VSFDDSYASDVGNPYESGTMLTTIREANVIYPRETDCDRLGKPKY